MRKCNNLAHVRVIKVEFPRPPQNSPEMAVTIMQSWCVFSIFNHIMKLANGPVVISKMEHWDPWPKAGGWQREVVFFLFSPPFACYRFRRTIWCRGPTLDALHIWNSRISNICFCLRVWQPYTHHWYGRWHHSTAQVCTCNGSGRVGLVSLWGNFNLKIFLRRVL